MPDYEEIIKQSQANVKSLGEKLKDFDNLYQEIKALKALAEGIPELFNKKFKEIVKLSEDYTNTLGTASKSYLDGSNTLFTAKLSELSSKILEFEKEITRLLNTDFTKLFKDLQKVFIEQTREDLARELERFEEKSKDLKNKIDELKKQIERLEKIDLEKHFDKFHKTLADIFGAISSLNLTLANVIQTLTGIVQSLGDIQTAINANHKETKQLIASFNDATGKYFKSLESEIKSVSEQTELLKSEVKTNRLILIAGITIILVILIYIAIKH